MDTTKEKLLDAIEMVRAIEEALQEPKGTVQTEGLVGCWQIERRRLLDDIEAAFGGEGPCVGRLYQWREESRVDGRDDWTVLRRIVFVGLSE